jgi:hypothetical protein
MYGELPILGDPPTFSLDLQQLFGSEPSTSQSIGICPDEVSLTNYSVIYINKLRRLGWDELWPFYPPVSERFEYNLPESDKVWRFLGEREGGWGGGGGDANEHLLGIPWSVS